MKLAEIDVGAEYGIWLPDKPPPTFRAEQVETDRYGRGMAWMHLKAGAQTAAPKGSWGMVRGRVEAVRQPYGKTTQGVEVAIAVRLERYGRCPLCRSPLLDEDPEIDERELSLVLHPASLAATWDEALLWITERGLESDRRRAERMDEELRALLQPDD